MSQNLMTEVKLVKVSDPTTAGTSDVTSAVLSRAGWENVVFFTSVGTAAANNNLKVQQGTLADGSDMADLAGSKTGNGASDEDLWVEISRPREDLGDYLRAFVLRGTSTTVGDIWALLWNGRLPSAGNNVISGTIYGEIHAAPAAGTA